MYTQKPNIIYILSDQLRKDVIGVYGSKNVETPNIDQLASQSLILNNAFSICPLCTPYRGMLMTGKFPTRSGILINFLEPNIQQNPNCLANIFAYNGYDTGYIGKWHLSSGAFGKQKEYEAGLNICTDEPEYIPPGPKRLGFNYWAAYNFHLDFNNYWYYRDEPHKIKTCQYETDVQFEDACNYIKGHQDSNNPFFLVIAPHQPHSPYMPEFTPPGYLENITTDLYWSPNVPANNPRTDLELRCYLAMVKKLDDNVGQLVGAINQSGLSDNTIIIFTSDHGEMHGSHNKLHKMVPYNEAIDVPLIIYCPSYTDGGKESDLIFTPLDFLPTLCSMAGLEIPGGIDGLDLSSDLFKNTNNNRDEVLIMNYSSNWNEFKSETPEMAGTSRCWPEWRGIRSKQYTYVKWLDSKEELYDNLKDNYQLKNIVNDPSNNNILNYFRVKLKNMLLEANDQFLPGNHYAEWFNDKRELIISRS